MIDGAIPRRGHASVSRQVAIPAELNDLRPPMPGGRVHALTGVSMGTTWTVKFVAELEAKDLADIRHDIECRLDEIVTQMSTWLEASDLSRFNRTRGEWQSLPHAFATVLTAALSTAEDTGGAYDPTIGPLVDLWGFGPTTLRMTPPTTAEIGAARARCGWQRLERADQPMRVRQPGGMSVDLSAIAKGFAVDQVVSGLRQRHVHSYLVEIGGELRGHGLKPDGHPWWVTIETPPPYASDSDIGRSLDVVVALHDLSMATSGDYRRYFTSDGTRYAHTIDPRTGYPVAHALASVTVLHRNCMTADALSTALFVLGRQDGLAYAEKHDLAALFVQRMDDDRGALSTSSAFNALLE